MEQNADNEPIDPQTASQSCDEIQCARAHELPAAPWGLYPRQHHLAEKAQLGPS
jgi:hypothetical protein